MKTSTKAVLGAAGLLLAALSPLPALAHTDVALSIGLGVPVYASPAPVYYAPPPPPRYYYAPRPVVVYQPYYAPRVYYRETYYRSGPRYDDGRYWDDDDRGHRHRHH